jgi:hypothetical protein
MKLLVSSFDANINIMMAGGCYSARATTDRRIGVT